MATPTAQLHFLLQDEITFDQQKLNSQFQRNVFENCSLSAELRFISFDTSQHEMRVTCEFASTGKVQTDAHHILFTFLFIRVLEDWKILVCHFDPCTPQDVVLSSTKPSTWNQGHTNTQLHSHPLSGNCWITSLWILLLSGRSTLYQTQTIPCHGRYTFLDPKTETIEVLLRSKGMQPFSNENICCFYIYPVSRMGTTNGRPRI